MKVSATEGFANPARIRIALAETGAIAKVHFMPVDAMAEEHRMEGCKAKTPDAVVPCLELADGTHIKQCDAITDYIDGRFEGLSLIRETPKQRDPASQVKHPLS
jgi:glutathione S-transferase